MALPHAWRGARRRGGPTDMKPLGVLHPFRHALARWVVLLMGWVWLGEQGQRLGWSVASGVLAVALWWALRLLLAQSQPVHRWPRHAPLGLGVLTAAGALCVASQAASPTSHALLLGLAGVWAWWSAALEGAAATARCPRRWTGGAPLLAAGLTGLATAAPGLLTTASLQAAPGTAAAAVLLAAAVLQPSHAAPAPSARAAMHTAAAVLPHNAMGLMMGSLWLSSAWCATAGWSPASVVGLHVLLMALLPALTRLDLLPRQLPRAAAHALPLALVLGGSLVLLWGNDLAHGITGMGLLALAWALHGERFATTAPHKQAPRHRLVRWGFALCGPALLLAVGWWSPTLGPQALQTAYGLLGACALVALVSQAARTWLTPPPLCMLPRPLGETPHEQH